MTVAQLHLGADPLVSQNDGSGKPHLQIVGVPHDSTSSYRPGSRFGPNAIRNAFLNIEIYSDELQVNLEEASIRDLGNLSFTSNVEQMVDSTRKVLTELHDAKIPTCILGGEHTITLASYSPIMSDVPLLVFDAHLDLRDGYAGSRLSHASYLRRLSDEGLSNAIHVGCRAACKEEWEALRASKIKALTEKTLRRTPNPSKLLEDTLSSYDETYVSIDLDVLDPAYAPGVGNPEASGMTSRQLLELLYTLRDKRIRSFDIVELAPQYDHGATAAVAARLLTELACIIYAKQR
jgi:agmatinase